MTTDLDTEARVRAGLATYARAMRVDRPPLGEVPTPTYGADRPVTRLLLSAAAVVVLVAVVAVAARQLGRDVGPAPVQAGGEPVHIVWPLGDVPPESQATPERIAESYVRDVLDLGPEWQHRPDTDDGSDTRVDRTVRFEADDRNLDRSPLDVSTIEVGGRWYVTGARTNDGPTIVEAHVAAGHVVVDAVPHDSGLLSPAVAIPATVVIVRRDGTELANVQAPMTDDRWRVDVPVGAGAEPAAVLVSRNEPATPGGAEALASVIVLPESIAGSPARDLFPAALPVGSYEEAWRYTLAHPADPRRDFRIALTLALGTVGNGRPPEPKFEQLVISADGDAMSGRYTTGDGGAGIFELARVSHDSPWFVTRVQDDAVDIRDVEVTPTEVRVKMTVSEDYRLAEAHACGGSAGQSVEEAWGHADVELLCRFSVDEAGTARALQTLETTGDHPRLIRFFDAWGP